MLIVIVGCGRMGGLLANKLSGLGKSIIIIDNEESAFDILTTDFSGFHINGDATRIEVLKQAKVDQADFLLVLTGDDTINLAVAQVGKYTLKVPFTIARVFDPARERIFKKMGIRTICPTRLTLEALINSIDRIEKEGGLSTLKKAQPSLAAKKSGKKETGSEHNV